MFTSVVGALTSLLPKYFIFSSYVPVLIFGFINLVLVYLFSAWSRSGIEFWLGKYPALTVGAAFVGTVVIAYIISAINDFMREFLEGKHVVFGWVEHLLCDEQKQRRVELGERYRKARRQRFVLESVIDRSERRLRKAVHHTAKTPKDAVAKLRNAAAAAQAATPGLDDPLEKMRGVVRAGALGTNFHDPLSLEAFKNVLDTIRCTVAAMARRLDAHPAPLTAALESDRRDLLLLMTAILDSMKQVEYEMGADLFTRFGNDPVKPTRMGNIAAAIQAYTIGRYKMEMTVFFSRLQTVLVRAADKGYALVLDAKAQLDFLVACCWFSALTTVVWIVLLALCGADFWPYFTVALAGTAATVAFYFLASQNYLAYGEVVRACIDVNRFTLLRELAIRQPTSLRDERMLWSTMSHLAFSGSDSIELSYKQDEKP